MCDMVRSCGTLNSKVQMAPFPGATPEQKLKTGAFFVRYVLMRTKCVGSLW
jgi:hypothetical protein